MGSVDSSAREQTFEHSFKDKICFITGASEGIGRATALAFARQGAKIAVVDVDAKGGAETCRQITAMGRENLWISCDVSKGDQVQSAVTQTVEKWGRLDIAFNNAGIEGIPAGTPDCTEDNWDRVLGINLKGAWLCMKHQIPQMIKQGDGGAIVNCASIAGLVGFQSIPAYVASKHGLVGLTKAAALENAQNGVRINAVCPGVIRTTMIDRFTQGNAQALAQLTAGEPMGRLGTPDEIASSVLWLCSTGASFVTGQALAVDGGWVAQ